jgi:hypothetical protein
MRLLTLYSSTYAQWLDWSLSMTQADTDRVPTSLAIETVPVPTDP